MMEPHLTPQQVARYRRRQMGPEDILALHAHAGECPDCLALIERTEAAGYMRSLFDPEPSEEELVRFVSGKMTAPRRGEIEAHLAGCASCASAMADLQEILLEIPAVEPEKQEIRVRARPPHRYLWWAIGAAALLAILVAAVKLIEWRTPDLEVSLQDAGGRIGLTRSGGLLGIAVPDPVERNWMVEALRDGRLPPPIPWSGPAPGALPARGDSAEFQPVSPVEKRVLSNRPEFLWTPLTGGSNYRVKVYTEGEKVVCDSKLVWGTRWQPDFPLPRGVRLGWQITARRGDDLIMTPAASAPRAMFELIPNDSAVRIDRERTKQRRSHLLLTVLYAREGLPEDAARELAILARANPGSATIVTLEGRLRIP